MTHADHYAHNLPYVFPEWCGCGNKLTNKERLDGHRNCWSCREMMYTIRRWDPEDCKLYGKGRDAH